MTEQTHDLAFVIDGVEYPSPGIETFDMGERRVMFDLCGIVQEDFAREEGETEDEHDERVRQLVRHPGFMEALMHIAYARGNPGLKRAKVQEVIDHTNYNEAIEKWGQVEEGDDSPPDLSSQSEHSRPSESRPSSSSEGSGSLSSNGSDAPDKIPAPIGASSSDTSSPRLVPST